jgi:hypothetical protein
MDQEILHIRGYSVIYGSDIDQNARDPVNVCCYLSKWLSADSALVCNGRGDML